MKTISKLLFILGVIYLLSPNLFAVNDQDEDNHQNMAVYSEKQIRDTKVEEVYPEKEFTDKYSRTVITPENLKFRIAHDRPIEKYSAYQGPISLDSYMFLKFKEQEQIINSRFNAMESRLDKMETSISDIKALLTPKEPLVAEEEIPAEKKAKLV